MLMHFEQFAVTSMLGTEDRPPRENGALCFGDEWERTAFGVALALSRGGHFEWEDFRQHLIAAITHWENNHALDDPSWSYYDCWLTALESVIIEAGLSTDAEIGAALAGLEKVKLTKNNADTADGGQSAAANSNSHHGVST